MLLEPRTVVLEGVVLQKNIQTMWVVSVAACCRSDATYESLLVRARRMTCGAPKSGQRATASIVGSGGIRRWTMQMCYHFHPRLLSRRGVRSSGSRPPLTYGLLTEATRSAKRPTSRRRIQAAELLSAGLVQRLPRRARSPNTVIYCRCRALFGSDSKRRIVRLRSHRHPHVPWKRGRTRERRREAECSFGVAGRGLA